ncbi:MAG: putative lipid II flippase FtsW [Anaerofustis sp.]
MKTFGEDLREMLGNVSKEAKKPVDRSIVMTILVLTCFGLIMVWSASMYNANLEDHSYYYVSRQLMYAVFGFVAMFAVSLIDFRFVKKYAFLLMLLALALLGIVMMLPETESVNGAVRWISIGGIVIQPSEITKIAVLLFLSAEIEKRSDDIASAKNFILLLGFCGVICLLIYIQPALSTAVVVAGLIIGMYFMSGGNLAYVLSLAGVGGIAVYFFITGSEWRMSRIMAFLDPWSDLYGSGWQPAQSLMALGSGGVFGVGIGNGKAKLLFLPEPQNDYIFSVIGEELGLIGCIALLAVYLYLIFKLIQISFRCPDMFSKLVCSGMGLLLSIQVFINVAVVTNLIPSTGVTLPFISAGGSSLVSLMLSFGVVLNISRNLKKQKSAMQIRGANK